MKKQYFKSLFMIVAVLLATMCICTAFSAESVSSGWCGDNLFYELTDDGVLTISGTGEMYDYDYHSSKHAPPWKLEDKYFIKTLVIKPGVTTIGKYAFAYCQGLNSVTLPNGLTSLGEESFERTDSLSSLTLPDSIKSIGMLAFSKSGLTSLKIPDGVTEISIGLFSSANKLESITIPDTVKVIGEEAFYECTELKSIKIPDGVTEIQNKTFYHCASLTTVEFSANVTTIGEMALANCPAMETISLLDGLTTVGNNAFNATSGNKLAHRNSEGAMTLSKNGEHFREPGTQYSLYYGFENQDYTGQCTGLKLSIVDNVFTVFTVPDFVNGISLAAFCGNDKLEGVTIPEGVEFIDDSAFEDCKRLGLQEVSIPSSLRWIGNYSFADCQCLGEDLIIPDGVRSIGAATFKGCISLRSITIPDSVEDIGAFCFDSCSFLTDVKLPNGIKCIDSNLFQDCSKLETIVIPDQVKEINSRAFWGCLKLKSVTIPGTVTIIGEEVFLDCPDVILTVEEGSYAQNYAQENDIPYVFVTDTPDPTPEPGIDPSPAPVESPTPVPTLPSSVSDSTGSYSIGSDGTATFSKPTGSAATVTVPDTITVNGKKVKVTAIADNAFKGKKLTTVKIGKNVKTIGKNAFADCAKLKTVKGGASVITIKDGAFSGCKVLKTFPTMNKLQKIDANAFKGAKALARFTIAKTVNSIGKNAFNGCAGLKTITVKAEKLTTKNVGAGAFKGINKKATFKCPKKQLKAYKTLFVKKGAPKTCKFK